MPKLCRYIILLLCFSCTCTVYAADSVQYQHYTIDNGLPSNNVYYCRPDRNGYLWITTDNGIVKYNGYDFKLFNVSLSNLPDNDVYDLYEDVSGRIWIYSLSGKIGYIYNNQFYEMPQPLYSEKYNSSRVSFMSDVGDIVCCFLHSDLSYLALYKDAEHYAFFRLPAYAWLAGKGDIYVLKNNELLCYNLFAPARPPKHIRQFTTADRKLLEINVRLMQFGNKPYRFETVAKGEALSVDLQNGRLRQSRVSMETGETGYVFIWGDTYHLISNRHVFDLDENFRVTGKHDIPGFAVRTQVAYFSKTGNGAEWYGTNGDGLWQTDKTVRLLQPASCLPTSPNARFCGAAGNNYGYWWDNKNGILYQADKKLNITRTALDEGGRINAVIPYDSTHVIICSNLMELQLMDTRFGTYVPLLGNKIKKGRFYNPPHKNWVDVYGNGNSSDYIPLASFYADWLSAIRLSDSTFLGFTALNMVHVREGKDSVSAIRDVNIHNRLTHFDVLPLLQKALIYDDHNFAVYDIKTDSVRFVSKELFRQVVSVQHDKWNNIYILTDRNLLQVNPYNLQYRLLAERLNLTNASISVSGDRLAIAGRFGLAVAEIGEHRQIKNFRLTLNLKQSIYREAKAVWIAGDKKVLVQTDKAFLRADMDSVLAKGMAYGSLDKAGFSFVMSQQEVKTVHNQDTIVLNQSGSPVNINAINFYGNGTLQYFYQFQETGAGWKQTASGELSLATLQPDVYYRLRIKVSDNLWNSVVVNAVIYITPYWWQTHNARVFFLIVGSAIFILAVIGIISLARQAVIRAQAKRRALTELELRAVHSQINPHFIFNTLSTALYFIDRRDYDNAYKHVNKFSHLLRSYLKSSHDRYVLLSEEIDMLKRYIELQQTRFENLFSYEIKVENRVPAEHIQIPSLLLQPLVENAINHGLFHRKEPGGRLFILFSQGNTSDELVCEIEDNGIGRIRSMDLKKQNDAERQSYGSKLTDKLVDIFRQYEAMNIHIEYIDKSEPQTGTIVRLTIGNVKYVV